MEGAATARAMVPLRGEEQKPLNKPSSRSLVGKNHTYFWGSVCHLGQFFRKRSCLVPPKAFKHFFRAWDVPTLLHMAVIYFPGSKVFPCAPAHLPLLTNHSAPCTAIPSARSEISSSAQCFVSIWLPFPCLYSYCSPSPRPSFPTLFPQCSFLRSCKP